MNDSTGSAASPNPLVSVCVLTYNHERYIAQCLESVLRQETSFPFEVIVRDDASTDGTPTILEQYAKRYPATLRLILESRNTWGDLAYKPLFGKVFAPVARGRYLASCEGDDYWIDDFKLQQQFDYMEAHPTCLLCSHATEIIRDDGGSSTTLLSFGNEDRDVGCDEIMENWAQTRRDGIASLHPSSCFTRREADIAYAQNWRIDATAGDFVRVCYMTDKAPAHFFARPMSAYRYLSSQSWTSGAEDNSRVLAGHYREFIEMAYAIDNLTGYVHHDAAMRGCKQRALLLAGMTEGKGFFESEFGSQIKPYLNASDWGALAALRILNAFGLRPARNTATGAISLRKLGRNSD